MPLAPASHSLKARRSYMDQSGLRTSEPLLVLTIDDGPEFRLSKDTLLDLKVYLSLGIPRAETVTYVQMGTIPLPERTVPPHKIRKEPNT